MLNDYELFLGGCYSAVVEIKNDYELYGFIDLMTKLGFKNYANYIKELDEKNNFIDTAKRYNNVNNLLSSFRDIEFIKEKTVKEDEPRNDK